MFEGEDFCVQGLARELNARDCGVRAADSRIVRAVAEQGESGVGSLNANLMLPAGFESKPQFSHEARSACNGILGDDFVVGNGLAGLIPSGPGLRRSEEHTSELQW